MMAARLSPPFYERKRANALKAFGSESPPRRPKEYPPQCLRRGRQPSSREAPTAVRRPETDKLYEPRGRDMAQLESASLAPRRASAAPARRATPSQGACSEPDGERPATARKLPHCGPSRPSSSRHEDSAERHHTPADATDAMELEDTHKVCLIKFDQKPPGCVSDYARLPYSWIKCQTKEHTDGTTPCTVLYPTGPLSSEGREGRVDTPRKDWKPYPAKFICFYGNQSHASTNTLSRGNNLRSKDTASRSTGGSPCRLSKRPVPVTSENERFKKPKNIETLNETPNRQTHHQSNKHRIIPETKIYPKVVDISPRVPDGPQMSTESASFPSTSTPTRTMHKNQLQPNTTQGKNPEISVQTNDVDPNLQPSALFQLKHIMNENFQFFNQERNNNLCTNKKDDSNQEPRIQESVNHVQQNIRSDKNSETDEIPIVEQHSQVSNHDLLNDHLIIKKFIQMALSIMSDKFNEGMQLIGKKIDDCFDEQIPLSPYQNIHQDKSRKNERTKNDDDNLANSFHKATTDGRGSQRSFYLLPEYDPNDSRWTLKYQQASPELIELKPRSGVYVSKIYLACFESIATSHESLGELLLTELFSRNALSVCALNGVGKDSHKRPGLDRHAILILQEYVEEFGRRVKWEERFDKRKFLSSLRYKLKKIKQINSKEVKGGKI